jgi:enediyne biosynthesis protein E4
MVVITLLRFGITIRHFFTHIKLSLFHLKNCYYVWFVITGILVSCTNTVQPEQPLFTRILANTSAINFENRLAETETLNIVEYLYFYNGGGVSIGDVNNDGYADIFFISNQGTHRLYINQGNFKFKDITQSAGIEREGNWATGVTMADVNADGWLDIYVCGVGNYKSLNGVNQLFINNGDLTFTEQAANFGLAFKGFSTHAAFFDYDSDGDLDLYLLNHSIHSTRSYGQSTLRNQFDSLAGDRLFKNKFIETGNTFFVDITSSTGIFSSQVGYGLGLGISDLNQDGYPDIYVSNDFHENDYLYINQKDGTYKESSNKSLGHTSRFSMGNEIADLNNDLWPDIFTTDMLPRDEAIIKTSAGEDSYEVFKFKLKFGYGKQVSRNTLQVNRGPIDSGSLIFSDVAMAAGVEATDWSWGPLAADFDGDGFKDIFITNGIARRPNDLDYITFLNNDSSKYSKQNANTNAALINLMPTGMVSNYIFKNNGDLSFTDKTNEWGLELPSLSNGAAYGDLDNDGDLDLVVNQLNGEALIYRNNTSKNKFLKVRLKAEAIPGNPFGIGTRVTITSKETSQMQELFPSRGWCSSSDYALTFGLAEIDSTKVIIRWPDGSEQDTTVTAGYIEIAYRPTRAAAVSESKKTLLNKFSISQISHTEDDFNAFNRESLIPHMLTNEGPAFAKGDVNNDGRDDFFIGGAKGQAGALYLQTKAGGFSFHKVNDFFLHQLSEDTDAVFIDADGDKDLDLVVVSGGHEAMDDRKLLTPRLYINNGQGDFEYSQIAFQNVFLNASCIRACDYDSDGDIDLFVGASVMPFLYGMSPVSLLLQNNGYGAFKPAINWLGKSVFDNPTIVRPGMVKDAIWTDLNSDKLPDLILVGEWMPITILIQEPDHSFKNRTSKYGLQSTSGMWNTIASGDFNKDGKPDFVVGNLGLNSRIKASLNKPLQMYLGDFDSNGGSDHILVYYNGEQSYPFASRDQLLKQIPSLKKKFPTYQSYRDVKLEDIITPVQKGNSALMKINLLTSVLLLSDKDSLRLSNLPIEAQYFPVFAIAIADVDNDQNQDILLTGNFSATQPDFGSYDAGVGLILKGNTNGLFKSIAPLESGFVTLGEGRAIQILKTGLSEPLILVARNNSSILAFKK